MSSIWKIPSALFVVCILFSCVSSKALVVDDTTTQNLTAPANGAPWANVGTGYGASGVYLKNGWVISARHVYSGTTAGAIAFAGTTYLSGPIFVLNNPDGSAADVVVFNLGNKPNGTAEIGVSSTIPSANASFTMIGYGAKRSGDSTTISYTGGSAKGYLWDGSGGASKSWGTNTRSTSVSSVQAPSANAFQGFATSFTVTGSSGRAQGALGDSGGGVFVKFGSSWVLAGTINAIAGFAGQQGNTAAQGNQTAIANAASYADQINAHISSTAPAPILTSTSPSLLITATSAQSITLVGSQFVSGATVEISTSGGLLTSSTTFVDSAHLSVSVMANTAETWSLRVINPDGVPSGAIDLPIAAAQTYANWLAGYPSLTGDAALPTADPDGDGLSNLQEYAFGSDPTSSTSAKVPILATATIDGQTYLTLTFDENLANTDLVYQGQMSTDLTQAWSNISDTILTRNGTIEQHQIRIPTSGSGTFLRVLVSK